MMRPILPLLLCLALPACAPEDTDASPAQAPTPVAYTLVRDSVSGAVLPRLSDARDPRARAVNERLDTLSANVRCDPRYVRHETPHYDLDARVAYAADSVLSVHVRVSAECGAAHDMHGVNLSETFDLRTGETVTFRQLFTDYERDAVALARVLFPARTARADSLAAAPSADDECVVFHAAGTLAERGFDYTFSEARLVVEPDFPHAVRHCAEEAVVPYERVRRFAAPGGILARVADARAAPRPR